MFVVGLPSSRGVITTPLRLHFGCNISTLLRGFLAPAASLCCWTPRSVFQDGSDDTGLANSAPWRVVTDVIVGRSRRRTRALPALVLCPPRGRSGLRRTLRVPAALPRCWVRTRIAPRPPPLAAHPFPSVHMGRLSRLGWRSQCMLTQLWGCNTQSARERKGPPADMPFAQPAARAGTGRRGVIAAGHRVEFEVLWRRPAVERRRLPAAHTAPPPSQKTANCLACSRLGSPSAPSFLLHPLGAPGRGCYPACSSLTQRPNSLPSGSALATSSLLTLFPECFSSFARATCSLSVSGAQYSNCASLGWQVYQPCSHYIPK